MYGQDVGFGGGVQNPSEPSGPETEGRRVPRVKTGILSTVVLGVVWGGGFSAHGPSLPKHTNPEQRGRRITPEQLLLERK